MNKWIGMGRLTKDPETKYTAANNTAKCSFTLAVDRRFKKEGEDRQADFINCVAWKNNAEFCQKYFAKSSKIVVVGRLENRSWDDNEGKKHYVTEVIVDETYFAEKKQEGTQQGNAGYVSVDDDEELPF